MSHPSWSPAVHARLARSNDRLGFFATPSPLKSNDDRTVQLAVFPRWHCRSQSAGFLATHTWGGSLSFESANAASVWGWGASMSAVSQLAGIARLRFCPVVTKADVTPMTSPLGSSRGPPEDPCE